MKDRQDIAEVVHTVMKNVLLLLVKELAVFKVKLQYTAKELCT